jgi:hypothetical protein
MYIGEETLGATGMHQLHKELRPKRALLLGSRRTLNKTFKQTVGLKIMK